MSRTTFSTLFGGMARRKKRLQQAHLLYGMVVASARNPDLFRRFDIPDTFDGRFEMLAAHLYLMNDRLRQDGDLGRALSQEVFDLFIADMDSALREAAVGDQVVPKRLAKMTRVVHGRASAYDVVRSSDGDQRTGVAQVVSRNIFDGRTPQNPEFAMADWMLERVTVFRRHSLEDMLNGCDGFTITHAKGELVT